MTRVEIRSPAGMPGHVRILLDGQEVGFCVQSFALTQSVEGDALPSLALHLVPENVAVDMPDVLVKLLAEQIRKAVLFTIGRTITALDEQAGVPREAQSIEYATILRDALEHATGAVDDVQETLAEPRSAFVESALAELRAIMCPHGNKLDECTDEACYLVASRTAPSGPLTGRLESMILAERDRVLAELKARATVAAERATRDLSTPDKVLDAAANDLARIVIEGMAERWSALPLAAQLAVMRYLRLANADEVLDAENDEPYARRLVVNAFNRARTLHIVPEFETAIGAATRGIAYAKHTGAAAFCPSLDLVFDEHGQSGTLEEWQKAHPIADTIPTTSEGEE